MKVIRTLVVLTVLGGAGYYVAKNYLLPTKETWLHGTWWLADAQGKIIEGKGKDGMVFHPNGTIDLVRGSGEPYFSCVYTTVVKGQVHVECVVRGEKKELVFQIENNRSRLARLNNDDGAGYIR